MTLAEIKDQVASENISKAIRNLLAYLKKRDDRELTNSIQTIQGNLSSIENDRDLGLMTNSEVMANQAKIRRSVLNFIDKAEALYEGEVKRPVIFLAFANDPKAPLDNLEKEEDKINRGLRDLHDDQRIEIYKESHAGIDDIYATFTRFRERILIFHYAGHANSEKLQLSGEDAQADGLAELIQQQAHLRLVFLNGCSTSGQVTRLLDLGIPAIIATSTPINDEKATKFAIQFYQSLADEATLEQAFTEARSILKSRGQMPDQAFEIHRGLGSRKPTTLPENPWGLYVSKDEVLDWKLA